MMSMYLFSICFLLVVFQHPAFGFVFIPSHPEHSINRHRKHRRIPSSTTTTNLHATISSGSGGTSATTASRQKRISNLENWSQDIASIQISKSLKIEKSIQGNSDAGLGLTTTFSIETNNVVVTVPTSTALSIGLPNEGPDDFTVIKNLVSDRNMFRSLPWYVQFSFYLYKLNNISSRKGDSNNIDMKPWLDTLPQKYTTPIHWTQPQRQEWLKDYPHMIESIERQESLWKDLYNKLKSCIATPNDFSYNDFVWGCETARSRAFSGGYTGSSFNPFLYVFTLILVTIYVGLNLGTLEQAANGAAVVFCVTVLQNFVIPKLFKAKKYVICPVIDMCNHNSRTTNANVAYEFFMNAYSLSTTKPITEKQELYISYGQRSNDQLLQYYGFVEQDNPYDIYVMPPLREWDISALESVCGTKFPSGRLQKLDRIGLLGKRKEEIKDTSSDETLSTDDADGTTSEGNPRGGVVLSRAVGVDPAVIQALRALVSTEQEWQEAGESVGNFAAEINPNNERNARLAARTAIEMELQSKATTLEEDRELLKRYDSSKSGIQEEEERIAILFRIEKKKLLKETIDRLR